ncbi:MAG: hypothetical protein ACI9TB_001783 [Parasphingorhabdus sp.]|jgi:hypothetical protein|tara:strand:+ start:1049 stop:1240 length:192 start_codon:yes stop_codon:yes gene_type:complete
MFANIKSQIQDSERILLDIRDVLARAIVEDQAARDQIADLYSLHDDHIALFPTTNQIGYINSL